MPPFWVGDMTVSSKKIAAVLAASLLLFVSSAYAQEEAASVQEQTSILTQTDETLLPIETESGSSHLVSSRTGSGGGFVFLRMVLVLALVVVIAYIMLRFIRKTDSSAGSDEFLRRVASVSVGAGKSVQVITLVDSAYLIGVSDNSVNLISKIEDKELINAMNLYADKNQNTQRPKTFAEVLDMFMPSSKSSAKPKNAFEDGASKQILDSLERQSRRLNNGE